MEIQNYKAINKGCVLGSFDLVIPSWQMQIKECMVFRKDTKMWVNLPSRKFENNEGKTCYFSFVKFEEQAHFRFQEKVLGLLVPIIKEAVHPQSEQIQEDELPF